MNTFIALLKREILEHKNIWRVPLILIGLALLIRVSLSFGNLAFDFNLPSELELDGVVDSVVSKVVIKSLGSLNFIVMAVMFIVAVFYALSCLYNERQDDSVLFWRSLPVSDTMTVASKLSVALILIPLVILLTQIVVVVMFLGTNSLDYIGQYLSKSVSVLAAIIPWSILPLVAWSVFCSAVAKKNPFLMAFIAPILVIFVDKLFLNGMISQTFIINRFSGANDQAATALLYGVVFSIVCIVFAVLKRKQRV